MSQHYSAKPVKPACWLVGVHEYMWVCCGKRFQKQATLELGDDIWIVRKPTGRTDGLRQNEHAIAVAQIAAPLQPLRELQTCQHSGKTVIKLPGVAEMGTKN